MSRLATDAIKLAMKCPHCGGDVIEAFRLYGATGGLARAKKLTKAKRSAIARKAAQQRWKGHKKRSSGGHAVD